MGSPKGVSEAPGCIPTEQASIIHGMSGEIKRFESEFASWLGATGAVATGFGRSALCLALEAVPVRGGQVLLPDFICAQVVEAVERAGGRPVFYRVSRTLRATARALQAQRTTETRAAVVAHYFGHVQPEIGELAVLCRAHGLFLVEDCALALGASAKGRLAGTFGDAAIFSLTKCTWCYGGGVAVAKEPEVVRRMLHLRDQTFHEARTLAWRYGLLRRTDCAANRPSLSRIAARTGWWFERMSGMRGDNFYDAGRFDTKLPKFAASRARRVLLELPALITCRWQIAQQIGAALGRSRDILFPARLEPGDTAAFVLVQCPSGEAESYLERVTRHNVTLRRTWAAYQRLASGQQNEDLSWLREHLVVLELDPHLNPGDINQIVRALEREQI